MASGSIGSEAARWLTRLQGTDLPDEDVMAAWQRWMALDPRHAEAFAQLEQVWHDFEALPRPPLLSRALVESDAYDGSVPVREWNERERRTVRKRRAIGIGLAASLVVAVSVLATLWAAETSRLERLDTRVGENRSVILTDGTRIVMGGQTRMLIKLTAEERSVALTHGEAVFTVAKDARRPFRVRAGAAAVTAVGTEFNVRRSEDRVTVSVLEGRVVVQPLRQTMSPGWLEEVLPSIRHGAPKSLDPGQQASVDRRGMEPGISLINVSTATGWKRGRLSFDDEPLRYVLETVNRYSGKKIVIGDPAIEDVRVSGTVLDDHIEGWIASLHAAFGLESSEADGTILLRRRRNPT